VDGVRGLRGCGLGLTPSGDDFLAGLLISLHLLQKLHGKSFQNIADAVFQTAKSDNLFSSTFLDLARRGLIFGRMKELISSLLTESSEAVRKAAEQLLAIGASSGADLGTGFLLTTKTENCVLKRWSENSAGTQALNAA
jgi:hypothetical protein